MGVTKQVGAVLNLLELVGPSQENLDRIKELLNLLEERHAEFSERYPRYLRFEKRADYVNEMGKNGARHSFPKAAFTQYEEDCLALGKPVREFKHIIRREEVEQ